jgi:hypothetical protein
LAAIIITMQQVENPALDAWLKNLGPETVWAQVFIQGINTGFTLRHVADRDAPWEALRPITLAEVRKTAMYNSAKDFRPLSASPDLPRGWRLECANPDELWRAMQQLYPGSIADWWAAESIPAPQTNYRAFTNRQSGMYRITQLLSDQQAADVTRAACAPQFCLKRRLWSVDGLSADEPAAKSSIPCLEPCAILLELARKGARIEQEEKMALELSKSDFESMLGAVAKLTSSNTNAIGGPAGDIASSTNPRRLQLLLEKLKRKVERSGESNTEE